MFKGDKEEPRREYRDEAHHYPVLIGTEFADALERVGVSLDEFSEHITLEKRNISLIPILLPPLILHFKWYDPSQKRYFEFGFSFEYFSHAPFDIVGRQLFSEGWGGMRNIFLNHEWWSEAEITFVAWSNDTGAYYDFLEKRDGTPLPVA